MKLIALIGEPATGKTAIAREVLQRLGPNYRVFKFGLLRGREYPNGLFVLGIYESGETFGGTDRLSMAVQPDAEQFLRTLPDDSIVFFEGDRLTRERFLTSVPRQSLILLVATCSIIEKQRRHADRSDSQPSQFLQSRATLIKSVAARLPHAALRNETPRDLKRNAARIFALLATD